MKDTFEHVIKFMTADDWNRVATEFEPGEISEEEIRRAKGSGRRSEF